MNDFKFLVDRGKTPQRYVVNFKEQLPFQFNVLIVKNINFPTYDFELNHWNPLYFNIPNYLVGLLEPYRRKNFNIEISKVDILGTTLEKYKITTKHFIITHFDGKHEMIVRPTSLEKMTNNEF